MPLHDQDRDYEVVPVAEGYDRWSAVYDGGGNALLPLEEPVVDQLLGDVNDLTVLDLACGTGRHALRLAAAGAHVTGLDFSSGMLAKAQAKPGANDVTWIQHDLATPLPFEDGTFQRIVCALALEHVPDLVGAYRAMRRVATSDGVAVITCMHPAMMLRGVIAHFTDPTTGRDVQPSSSPYEIADFVNAALAAGWRVDRMEERTCNESLLADAPHIERYLGWPLLWAMRLTAA